MAKDLFAAVASGKVKVAISQRYKLNEVARAHMALESRRTQGSMIVVP